MRLVSITLTMSRLITLFPNLALRSRIAKRQGQDSDTASLNCRIIQEPVRCSAILKWICCETQHSFCSNHHQILPHDYLTGIDFADCIDEGGNRKAQPSGHGRAWQKVIQHHHLDFCLRSHSTDIHGR
jgi:hypothetical protein